MTKEFLILFAFYLFCCNTCVSFHHPVHLVRSPFTSLTPIRSTAHSGDDLPVVSIDNEYRRELASAVKWATLLTTTAVASHALRAAAKETDATINLGQRVKSQDAQMLPRGAVQAPDVFYPSFFNGEWNTTSIGTGYYAPLGDALFGGKGAIRAVQRDMNETLVYRSKFLALPDGRIIADRVFNVKSIAVASMGEESIIDDAQPDADVARRLHLGLAPSQDMGNLFDIDLIAVRYVLLLLLRLSELSEFSELSGICDSTTLLHDDSTTLGLSDLSDSLTL